MNDVDECDLGGHLWRDVEPWEIQGKPTYAEQVCERCPAYRNAPDWR